MAVPVRPHVSIAEARAATAATRVVGHGGVKSVENPTPAGGGTATNAGAIPAPTIVAQAKNAASSAVASVAASVELVNAESSEALIVALAAATVVDTGTTAAPHDWTASAHSWAHSAVVVR